MMKRLVEASRSVTLEQRKLTMIFMGNRAPVLRPPGPSRTATNDSGRRSQWDKGPWDRGVVGTGPIIRNSESWKDDSRPHAESPADSSSASTGESGYTKEALEE